MKLRPSENLDAYQQDTGSKEFCLTDMRPKADTRGMTLLVDLIDRALQDCDGTRGMEYDWSQSKTSGPIARKAAVQIDVKLDRSLGQFHTIIEAYAAAESDSPKRQAARRIKAELLPRGVFPITSLKYEQQHARIKEFYQRATTTFSADVDTVGLTGLVTDIGSLNNRFGDHLAIDDGQVTYDHVVEARRQSDDSFARVIMAAHVLTSDDPDAASELLAAFFDQQKRIETYRKRRGTMPIVDPGTGEIVDDEAGDGPVAPTDDTDADPSTPVADDTDTPAGDDIVDPDPVGE